MHYTTITKCNQMPAVRVKLQFETFYMCVCVNETCNAQFTTFLGEMAFDVDGSICNTREVGLVCR